MVVNIFLQVKKTDIMKRNIIITCLMLLIYNFSIAQSAPYKVVFDVTTKDTIVHQMVIRWVKEILSTSPTANVEIVFYAKSLDMITQDKSVVAGDVVQLAATKNVSFKVCEAAMKNNMVEKSQLLKGVETVPDGIYEIISRQHEGWGYIKATR